MNLPQLAIRRPVLAIMLNAIIALFGIISVDMIGVDRLPKIEIPFITVTTTQIGADPAIIDSSITNILESSVNSIPGIDYIASTSLPGASIVAIAFELSKDINVAFNEVQSKVNQVINQLPRNTDPPIIDKVEIGAEPIIWLVLRGNRTLQQLNQYASNVIKKRLQNINGVGNIILGGERKRTIRININPEQMTAYRITPQDIALAFQREHLSLPGGFMVAGATERLTNLDLELHSPTELSQMVISYRNGASIRLNQIANIEDGLADKRSAAQFNGEPTVGLGIIKVSGANTVDIISEIRKRLKEEIIPQLPPGMKITVAADNSHIIIDIISALYEHLWLGAILAALVVWLFLKNVRATLIIAISIPISLLGGIAAMYLSGFTFNILTLLALLLLIGVVVDDSIVVLENIYRHLEEKKGSEPPDETALSATQEVMFAVFASTLTIVSIFIPVIFLGGIIGRFFQSFAIVVVIGVIISLFVSITLTPMLCARYLKLIQSHSDVYNRLENAFILLETRYSQILHWSLSYRWKLLGITLVIFLSCSGIFQLLGKEFSPQIDEERFIINFKTPMGSSIDYTEDRLRQIEKTLRKHPEVRTLFSTIGTGSLGEVTKGNIYVQLVPKNKRNLKQYEVMTVIGDELAKIPGVQAFASNPAVVGGGRGEPLQFVLEGPSLAQVGKFSKALSARLQNEPRMGKIDLDLGLNQPQYQLKIDRNRAQAMGLNTQDIVQTFSILGGGLNVAKYNDSGGDGNRYDIRLMATDGKLIQPSDLSRIFLRNNDGKMIRMDNVASLVPTIGAASISRSDLLYASNFYVAPVMPLSDAVDFVRATAAEILPLSYTVKMRAEAEEFGKTSRYISFAFTLAIVLVYMVLASQFNSFLQPITLMLALPLAIVGALVAIWLAGFTLNIYSMIGMVLLMGLVAKNSILLIDLTNHLRQQGYSIDDALRKACPLRMRPVIMTSLTIILALLPAAFGHGAGADTNAPLAVAVIGGMISSTLLTLIVIPAAYSLMENWLLARSRKNIQ